MRVINTDDALGPGAAYCAMTRKHQVSVSPSSWLIWVFCRFHRRHTYLKQGFSVDSCGTPQRQL